MAADAGRSTAGRSTGANDIEALVSTLLAHSVKAFHAFADLSELAENMRILSLNAELVAGRAGDAGRAVRALTQYTRELVNRLAQAQRECGEVMRTSYRHAADALRHAHELRLLARAEAMLRRDGRGLAVLAAADEGLRARMAATVEGMVESVHELARQAGAVEGVVAASDTIATNIAIEAAGAGAQEAAFRNVAETMRDYVRQLRRMTAEAGAAVRRAQEEGRRAGGG